MKIRLKQLSEKQFAGPMLRNGGNYERKSSSCLLRRTGYHCDHPLVKGKFRLRGNLRLRQLRTGGRA